MEISEQTVNIIIKSIETLERNIMDKFNSMEKLFDQKINAIECSSLKFDERLETHEEWLTRHNAEISELQNMDGKKALQVFKNILKVIGGAILMYLFYRAFPGIAEVIK